MRPDEYSELALRTENNDFEAIRGRLKDDQTIRLHHAAEGMATEVGEFTDAIKRHLFYGAPLDPINLAEELGDLMWYINQAINALRYKGVNASWSRIMSTNISKLMKRYPDSFNALDAVDRDLDAERLALEGK